MTTIFHPIKDRTIEVRGVRLKHHSARISVTANADGGLDYVEEPQAYVEFTVIGKNREYQDHMSWPDFKLHNPDVSV